MSTLQDPYGQTDYRNGNFYGLKLYLLQEFAQLKQAIAKTERLIRNQEVIVNDATRAVVLRELVDQLRKSAADNEYNAGYEEMAGRVADAKRMRDEAGRISNWADYLMNYGWLKKYLPNGEPKVPTLADKIDDAYISGGADAVLKLMAK